ncbi:guanine nucleotide-binding protein subunit gamma 3-like [Cucumis melo var. makuwa]|uniref:Guanine nucleotide-binding protein subunit gamma 3-like n=1 Tax=Cucumis melo var. makuwa TaxID=1194695 RepID=A0A5D3CFA0_CUCMM|nr:guanine nucleotide-binding protein subunit gamma 3-like [Cucumis melo var. makuwa]
MAARSVYSSSVSSLPPPSPKSPPEYPDLYGKRREIANIQTLEREIGFLEVSLNLKMIISVYIISSPSSFEKLRTSISSREASPRPSFKSIACGV